MTIDDRLESRVANGLRDVAGPPGADYLDDLLRRTSRTRQRHAWAPFARPIFPRHVPPWRRGKLGWRLSQMTPLMRYTVVAGLALALGVTLTPFFAATPPSMTVPSPSLTAGPSQPPIHATRFTGTISLAPDCSPDPVRTLDRGVRRERTYLCDPQAWVSDDPRFTGDVAKSWNADVYAVMGSGLISVTSSEAVLTNDGGTWTCFEPAGISTGEGLFTGQIAPEVLHCEGSGGYSGFSAVIVSDWSTDPVTMTGLVFEGAIPPAPGS